MPIYDFMCMDCRRPFDVFMTYAEYGSRRVTCPDCRSQNVRRRIPRVRVAKSEESRLDSMAGDFSDPSALAGLENDPKAMGQMMRKMGRELGEEMPPEFDEVVGRLEKGESPDQIEKTLPDLGSAPGGGDEGL